MLTADRQRWLKRKLVRHRRPLAAGCAFLSALLTISALSPSAATDPRDVAIEGNRDQLDAERLGDGLVAAPVRFADGAAAGLLGTADVVDVIAADGLGGGAVIADQVEVVFVTEDQTVSMGRDAGTLVVLAVSTAQATELAAATAVGPLSFVLHARS